MTELVRGIARLLFPAAVAVALALLVKGYAHVGDGFSAGAVAGLGALVQYACLGRAEARERVGARWVWPSTLLGLAILLATALGPMAAGLPPVTHRPAPGDPVTMLGALELHTAILFDLGVALQVYGVVLVTIDRLLGEPGEGGGGDDPTAGPALDPRAGDAANPVPRGAPDPRDPDPPGEPR